MKRLLVIAPLMLLLANSLHAQKKDSVRNIYIERFPDYFFVWPLLKQRTTSFKVVEVSNRGRSLEYKPNNSYGGGFGVYLFELAVEVTFAIPMNEQKIDLYGKSKASDLQLNILSKHWGADVFYQKYNGFYVTDPNKVVPINTPYPQRPDLATSNFGLNGIYIFNKDKFSLRSSYNFAERQRKSAGSVSLAATMNWYEVKGDSSIYGKNYEQYFGAEGAVKDFKAFTFGISPGYTYTLVFKERFFVNGSISVGPAFREITYVSNDIEKHSTGVDAFVDFRFGAGWNGERFFSGINFVSQTRSATIDQARFTSTNTTIRLLVGYRFKEFGILKKRALDILPFKK